MTDWLLVAILLVEIWRGVMNAIDSAHVRRWNDSLMCYQQHVVEKK